MLTNLSGVNSFAERYRIQAGVPSTSNDVGDLVFDTTAQKLKVFDGSSYQLAGSSVNGTSHKDLNLLQLLIKQHLVEMMMTVIV